MAITKKQLHTNYLLLDEKTPFAVKEAFNMLRTNILYMPCDDKGGKVIAITSAEEGTGKSSTIASLALSFANSSKKVLLIDADMRCPRQHKFFKYDKDSMGLSEYLAGISTTDEMIFQSAYDKLDIISSGHIPPSPSELVLSSRFSQLISELKNIYDYVFIDFPPVGVVSDAAAVAKFITGYIFVVRANHSDLNYVNDAIQKLENVEANILGIVFNDLDYKTSGYGSGYKPSVSKYARQASSPKEQNK